MHWGLDGDRSSAPLSHGQKQLFGIARALLRPGRVVVLDEVTSRSVNAILYSPIDDDRSEHVH